MFKEGKDIHGYVCVYIYIWQHVRLYVYTSICRREWVFRRVQVPKNRSTWDGGVRVLCASYWSAGKPMLHAEGLAFGALAHFLNSIPRFCGWRASRD